MPAARDPESGRYISVGWTVRTKDETKKVKKKADDTTFTNMRHAAGLLRKTAARSIRKRQKPSPAGTPPHTRRGRLRKGIRYAAKTKAHYFVGPEFRAVGTSGAAHEFGGRYRNERYPARPFMRPALDIVAPRLPRMWAGSIR